MVNDKSTCIDRGKEGGERRSEPIITRAGKTISRVSIDGVSAPVARFHKDLDAAEVQRSIDAAVVRMVAADKRRIAAANRETPRKQHIEVFNRDLARVSRLAKAYDDAREQVVRLKVILRSLTAQSGTEVSNG